MKFTWNTATGPITEDIPDDWNEILVRMDKDDYNNWKNDHRNEDHGNCHRHNCSLDALIYEGEDFGEWDKETIELLDADDTELALLNAIASLNEQQKRLIEALFYEQKSGKEYAAECGVKPSAITQQKTTVLKKLKNILLEP